ncbi:MAG: peptidylprolyl isomerase [Sandaracinaceae bacterium]
MRRPELALALFVTLAGCDGSVEVEGTAAASREAPLTGVTNEGEQIVFAGRQPNEARRPVARPNEERLIREPNSPDPENGQFTLEEAVVGLPIDGALIAEIETELGSILCELDPQRSPIATANFVGLARGARPFWDPRAGEWVTRPAYGGTIFHRVIPGYLIQGGDQLSDGTGTVGYTIPDEHDDTLSHDRAGQLCVANMDGPNTGGAQFFITDGPQPQLDEGGYTIFGQCRPLSLISEIARVPQRGEDGNRPLTDVHLRRVLIRRVVGGLAAAEPTRPQLPEGEPEVPREASPDPSDRRGRSRFNPLDYGTPSPIPEGVTGPPVHNHGHSH